jgi:hypothetical protein
MIITSTQFQNNINDKCRCYLLVIFIFISAATVDRYLANLAAADTIQIATLTA